MQYRGMTLSNFSFQAYTPANDTYSISRFEAPWKDFGPSLVRLLSFRNLQS